AGPRWQSERSIEVINWYDMPCAPHKVSDAKHIPPRRVRGHYTKSKLESSNSCDHCHPTDCRCHENNNSNAQQKMGRLRNIANNWMPRRRSWADPGSGLGSIHSNPRGRILESGEESGRHLDHKK